MDTGVIIADPQMRIIDINETASMMLDLKNKRVIGQPLHAFLDTVPDHFPDTAMQTNEIHQKERLTNKRFRQIEIKKGFDITVLEIRASLLIDKRKNRRCWIVELRDVTGIQAAKKLLVEQHEELAIKTEQQRVARDLHDNMGQIISYTKIQLQSIQRELARNNTHKVNEQIERLKQVSDEAHEKLREYIFNLRQGEESHLSFRSLLNNMITESFQHSPVEFHVEIDDDTEDFLNDPNRKFHLISLTKEAITNSLKHSGATMITIGARKTQSCIDYYIRDNGRGISSYVMAQEELPSWGLKLMKERAILTGGELQIMSLENRGITLRISYRGD
jgi:PAS domain S-box-containing protein